MTPRHLVFAAALLGAVVQIAAPPRAGAQSTTSGAIQGQVVDADTGDNLAGVTIVVTSPVLQGTQTAISDENGLYKIAGLPPGNYRVTFYINQLTIERSDVTVSLSKTTPVFQKIKLTGGGEIVRITDTPPAIDPTSTTQGVSIDKNYLRNVPVPGRTFDAALGAAAGSQNDGLGVGFSGSSSLENQYFVDGINTTGLTFGTVGSPVINDFIEEIEVVTGGYNAEYGRATGGVVNVVTKTGSNQLKGSVFSTFQPGFLRAPVQASPINASSIDASSGIAYVADAGFEVGGPIIQDRLWFYAGFAPQLSQVDTTRTTKRQSDCRQVLPSGALSACDARPAEQGGFADGEPDKDPRTGFFITDTLDEEVRSTTVQIYNALGKLNFAANPENQGQLTMVLRPGYSTNPAVFGIETSGSKRQALTTDVAAKWTSKFNDNRTELEGVVGWHRDHLKSEAFDPSVANQPLQILSGANLGIWGDGFGAESQRTRDGCRDGGDDPYKRITNCPMVARAYAVGGPGGLSDDTEQRLSALVAATHRVKLFGNHELKAGIDVESNTSDKARLYSGGAFLQNFVGQRVEVTRWVQLRGPQDTDPRFDNRCATPNPSESTTSAGAITYTCDYLGGNDGDPGTEVASSTLNWSAYLRDSWQILPNLTLNAGLRYEEQRLRYAEHLQHTVDALTEESLGKNAITLQGLWSPRIGAIYDWTQEGRSKVYVHWGRFYESIPLDINTRSFGGEVQFVQNFSKCDAPTDPAIGGANGVNCITTAQKADTERLVGASGTLVAPGLEPQYMDELVAGVEYEVIDDLKVGLSYQNRSLGRVIEDLSTDGANTYLIGNPGEWSAEEEHKLMARIAATDNPVVLARLNRELSMFRGIRGFDKPRRDYNALQLTVTRRFSQQLYLQGSYTYSRVTGNYPGLVSYDNGQVDPNISSQYDLIELLANREGPLPQDRPHYIKIDGYYTFDLAAQGSLTVGARIRAFSGITQNALAAHYLYGPNESYLLPRGELGRSDFDHGVDLHVGYRRDIGRGMAVEVYVDVFNVYNHQGTLATDNTYAPSVSDSGQVQNANPISGGSYEDLIWLKQIDAQGVEQPKPVGKNPNFGNTIARYTPTFALLGARVTF